MELRCKSFYTLLECGEKARLEDVIYSDNKRWFIFYDHLDKINKHLALKEFEESRNLIHSLDYSSVDFEYPFLDKVYGEQDKEYLYDYVEWFISQFSDCFVEVAQEVIYSLPEPLNIDELHVDSLKCNPTFYIVKDDEEFIVFCSYNLRGFSLGGRSIKTRLHDMLDIAVAKTFYCTANALYVSISDVKKKKALRAEPSLSIDMILDQLLKLKASKNCSMCTYSSVCQSLTLSETFILQVKKVEHERKAYELPLFDEYQMSAIHSTGKIKVYAGPGSGKTATLVGRVNHLVNNLNIPPENLLVLSFTNKAVVELKERTSALLPQNRECFIATIDSLCSYILQDNKEHLDFGLNIKTIVDRKRLLRNISKNYPNMQGFNYNKIYGTNGFIDMLLKRVTDYLNNYRNAANVFADMYNLGYDFFNLAHEYDEVCKSLGYISFDEQIHKTIEFLLGHEDILNNYKKIWKYVMVDEYQDISADQHLLITLLTTNEAFIVGDDDQSIYGFRNGDSKFMRQFEVENTIVLKNNYRSTSNIINLALKNVENLEKRMDKEIIANKSGKEPVIVNTSTPKQVNKLISSLLENQPDLRLNEIAILSAKNEPLNNLAPRLNYPSVMGKNYVVKSPLFALFTSLLTFKINGFVDDLNLYHVINCLNHSKATSLINITKSLLSFIYKQAKIKEGVSLFDFPIFEELGEHEDLNFYAEVLCFISSAMKDLDILDCSSFLIELAHVTNMSDTYVLDSMLEIFELNKFYSMNDVLSYFITMRTFDDTTSYETNETVDAINLLTMHESKGKEFSAVIIYDSENIISEKEKNIIQRKNLAYVGMTRAKNNLFILSGTTTDNNRFLRELIGKGEI